MIHATNGVLDRLEPLLTEIRCFKVLKKKAQAVFYYKSQAFLHFHEDATGIFADVKIAGEWCRHPVSSAHEQTEFLNIVGQAVDRKNQVVADNRVMHRQ